MTYLTLTDIACCLQNYFNLTNYNFFDVDVVALEVTAYYDQRIVASETNSTQLTLPMRSTMLHYITMNITFHEDSHYIM